MSRNDPPGVQGYFYPAEWNRHRATWLSWPHNRETWPGGIETVYQGYLQFIEEIAKGEKVCINVTDEFMKSAVLDRMSEKKMQTDNIEFFLHPTNDAWCRDHGPHFLINKVGGKLVVDWEYNAWGNKYPPFNDDNSITAKIASVLNLSRYTPGLVLEGGSVDFNGAGTVLTTTSCLLNHNRNPAVSRSSMEQKLKEVYGVRQVLWLDHGIAGDDTDGHIDTITRFIAPDAVVTVVEDDPSDENFEPLQENLARLSAMRLFDGRPLRIFTIPMPQSKYNQGQRLPASYANFYICNHSVVIPTYRDSNDEQVLSIMTGLFKNRKVTGIDSSEIIRGLGSLHCLCMQEPLNDYSGNSIQPV